MANKSIFEQLKDGFNLGVDIASETDRPLFVTAERHVYDDAAGPVNMLACGDNLSYMRWLLSSGYGGKVKCIYIDPPFFTKSKYNAAVEFKDADGKRRRVAHLAYDDMFERDLEHYAANMTARLILMRELLADDGLIWLHLDWHSSHYMRVIMDEVFGARNFVNEIVWKYKSGGSGKRHFSRKHDTLLLYSKSSRYKLNIPQEKSYNRGLKPYRFKGVKEYKDSYGWYTMVNMKDVWSLDMVGRTSKERTGYATQKPVELLRRIIESSTNEGDLCADFFCGSGSFADACDRTGRKWIGCDSEEIAISMAKKRLDRAHSSYSYMIPDGTSIYHSGLEMEMTGEEDIQGSKRLYKYRVRSFVPEVEYGYISNSDRDVVRDTAYRDPARLIDYIMVDPNHNDVFSCEMSADGGDGEVMFLSRGEAAFIVTDVFGREYHCAYRRGERLEE